MSYKKVTIEELLNALTLDITPRQQAKINIKNIYSAIGSGKTKDFVEFIGEEVFREDYNEDISQWIADNPYF